MSAFERKPIPKSLRFEVFKRDAFTCQCEMYDWIMGANQ